MTFRTNGNKKTRLKKIIVTLFIIFIVLVGAAIIGARIWYDQNLQPVSQQSRIVAVEIPVGSLVDDIAVILKSKDVIRSEFAFLTYVRTKEYADILRYGVYNLDPSKSTQEIVDILVRGAEASNLVTIPPGLRLDQVRQRLIEAGFTSSEVDEALNPALYTDHPALVAKPDDASLEGYLYPESFQITANTTARQIIIQSLDQMAKKLTPDRIESFTRQGLTPHEAIILASVVEREVHQPNDRRIVAQLFLKRLREGISLGADATYVYAAEITGEFASPELDNPYNTRKYSGLPPGPISNVGETSLDAVASPADTDFLYFISGDDGKNYFAYTEEEHLRNIELYCQENCGN